MFSESGCTFVRKQLGLILVEKDLLSRPRCLLWQDKMCVVARQDLCCGKTRCVLWHDKISFVPRHKGDSLRPPPRHNRDLVLPQRRSCLATTHILSCHNRDLVLPQHTSCLATTEILSCLNTHLVLPQQTSLGAARRRRRRRASIPGHIPDQHAQEKISA